MPDAATIDNAYRRALVLARQRNFQLTRQGVERMYRTFATLLNGLTDSASEARLTPERAERLRQELEGALRQLELVLVRTTEQTVAGTLTDLVEIHRRVTAGLFQRFGDVGVSAATGMFAGVPARALAAVASRPNASAYRTLIHRKIQALAPEIDTFIEASIAKGTSVSRTRKDLARIMARDDVRLERLLDQYEAGEFDFRALGLDESDAKGIRTLLYDAKRIMVSEPNNAYREGTAAAMDESPVVTAAQWQRSGRHHIPCPCDILAETDAHGYGAGMYPPSAWPIAPHPFCGCTQGRVLFRRPQEWNRPKPPARPLAIDLRDESLSAPWAEQWTEAERRRNHARFAASVVVVQRSRRAA